MKTWLRTTLTVAERLNSIDVVSSGIAASSSLALSCRTLTSH